MPFDIEGFVEVTSFPPEAHGEVSLWSAAVDIGAFSLQADTMSSQLFGLAKNPNPKAHFAERGVPKDSSEQVARDIKRNEQIIAQYGEGDSWYTYAYWHEIKQLDSIVLESGETDEYGWGLVFDIIRILEKRYKPEHIRLVVWGNW